MAAFRAECEATEPTTSSAAEAARLRRLSTKNVICCASRAASTQAAPRSGQASLRELGLRILLPAPSPVTQWAPGLPSCRTFGLRHLLQTALKHLAANRAEEVAGLMLRKPWRPKTSFGFCCVGCSRALVEDRGAGRVSVPLPASFASVTPLNYTPVLAAMSSRGRTAAKSASALRSAANGSALTSSEHGASKRSEASSGL